MDINDNGTIVYGTREDTLPYVRPFHRGVAQLELRRDVAPDARMSGNFAVEHEKLLAFLRTIR